MKKFILMAFMAIMLVGAVFAQQTKKHLILTIPTAATAFGEIVKIGDFVYITEDSTLYSVKIQMGPNATGTYMKASTARYNVVKQVQTGPVATTTGTFSSTLGVTGTATFAGALNAAGAIGFGTSNNKVTIAAATGNTAIAGTLAVTGVATIQGQTMTADHVNNIKFGNSVTATDTVFGPVISTAKVVSTGTVVGTAIGVSGTDTVTTAPVGTLCYRAADSTMYLKIKLTGPKSARWMKVTVSK